MHQWKVPLKYRGMLSFPSGPLGLGQAADTMVWGGNLRNGGNKNLQAHTYWSYVGIQLGCLILLQKHPLVTTAATVTAIAGACHSPPPQPRSLRGFIVVVFVVIVSSLALPSPPSPLPSSVIYLIVVSACPLPSIIVRSSSFFTHFITISPLAPPSFVDCCFKPRTKPLRWCRRCRLDLPLLLVAFVVRPCPLPINFFWRYSQRNVWDFL